MSEIFSIFEKRVRLVRLFFCRSFLVFSIVCTPVGFFTASTLSISTLSISTLSISTLSFAEETSSGASESSEGAEAGEETEVAASFGDQGIFSRSLDAGPVVFMVLLALVAMSIFSWAIAVLKVVYLRRTASRCEDFIAKFWENKSLNDLNSKLVKFDDSPAKEIFKSGYAELVKGSQMKDQASDLKMGISTAMSNLARSLQKAKSVERRKMESYLSLLAISASAAPFIGLFGTVWGIMNAFESIAQSGSTSLAAVAPGISEALIATAFGLAAAIPAVIGYNIANAKIRGVVGSVDGFCSDFMNIVERYLVTDQKGARASQSTSSNPRI